MNNRKSLIFVLPLIALVLMACRIGDVRVNRRTIEGSGKAASEEREVSNIERVTMTDIGDLTIIQGDEEGLTVEADDNLLGYIETRVRGRELEIGFEDGISVQTDTPIRYTLRVKDLSRISVSGSANIESEKLEVNDLTLEISGSGNVKIADLQAEDLKVRISGSGSFSLAGKIETQDIDITGSGDYSGGDLESQRANVGVSGSGNVTLWAVEELDVRITGFGNVSYYGKPQVSQSISGSGGIKSQGEHQ